MDNNSEKEGRKEGFYKDAAHGYVSVQAKNIEEGSEKRKKEK